jgi:hypothetical protein
MKTFYSLFFTLIFVPSISAQTPTWVADVAPVLYDNCSHCHHEGQVAPFSIMGYEDATTNALSIYSALEDGHMPPWPADPEYRHFVGETIVTDQQIADILAWIEGGMPFGDPDLEPSAPEFNDNGTLLDHVDFVAAIEPYTLQSNGEEYRWFVIPTNFAETKYIQGIEVFAGLPEVVHHADISLDVTGNSAAFDALDPLSGFNGSTGWPTYTTYMNAWQPGAGPAKYPDNWGIPLPPGADIVIEIHYGPGAAEEIDNTYMNLQFVDDPNNVRPISVGWLMSPGNMTDGPLVIPANQVSTFHQEVIPFWSDKSVISICPHMHLLGQSYKVWMETPSGDSIPLCDIPQWDFHWQFYYMFQQPQHIPAGSIFKSEAVYDNTTNNELNPNNPPITVYNGSFTVDEMFLCYFIYANYQPGDEDIILDPDLITAVNEARKSSFSFYPNPVADQVSITLKSNEPKSLLRVLDSGGSAVLVQRIVSGQSIDLSNLAAGSYFLELRTGGAAETQKFVKL